VRTILVLTLLCLSATRAFPHGAVSVSPFADGTFAYGISVDQRTRQAAILEANRLCLTAVLQTPGRVLRECRPATVFKNRCAAFITATAIGFAVSTGDDETETRENVETVCLEGPGMCRVRELKCDTRYSGYLAQAIAFSSDTFEDVSSWWAKNVKTPVLIISAAFIILSAGLLYTTLQMRKLRRIIEPPPISRATRRWWPFGTSGGIGTRGSRKDRGPLKGPVLDEKTIREAFEPDKKGREEFEL
jgi:Domain of unknown function (DUF4189)